MSLRALSVLQWLGVLAGAGAWTAQHVVGFGIGEAKCSAGGLHWGITFHTWQLAAMASAALVVVLAEACAAVVFLRTRGANYGDGPLEEVGEVRRDRLHFFATTALVANVLFLAIPLLDGLGAVFSSICAQS
ncbi:MAG: hypothetical protein JO073_11695 [Actinobacteria bacterium]|nr:hypothetical protein [Actinomycetota bacterium]